MLARTPYFAGDAAGDAPVAFAGDGAATGEPDAAATEAAAAWAAAAVGAGRAAPALGASGFTSVRNTSVSVTTPMGTCSVFTM